MIENQLLNDYQLEMYLYVVNIQKNDKISIVFVVDRNYFKIQLMMFEIILLNKKYKLKQKQNF